MSEVEQNASDQTTAFVVKAMEVFVTPLVLLLTALALLLFIYGAFRYLTNTENEQARAEGRSHMLFGIIGLFVMISAYTIMSVFANTFGLKDELDKLKVEAPTETVVAVS